jgi:hypothetical protein
MIPTNDFLRTKKTNLAAQRFLNEITQENEVRGGYDSGAFTAESQIEFASQLWGGNSTVGQTPAIMLHVACPSGLFRREIFIHLPSGCYASKQASKGNAQNHFKLRFFRAGQLIGDLPLDASGLGSNAQGNLTTSADTSSYSVLVGVPSSLAFDPATTTPQYPSRNNILITVIDHLGTVSNILISSNLSLLMDIDAVELSCDNVNSTGNANAAEAAIFLGILTSGQQ